MKRDAPLLVAVAMTGLAALALEVIWSRAMIPWVGGTALSQIATVAIYMGGLFVGSALAVPWLRRVADPRRAFLAIEMGAAVLSLAAVFGLPLADPLFALFSKGELLGSGAGSLLRGLAGGGLMLPATILMGLSFPLAIAAVDDWKQGRSGGERGSAALVYGVNTLGATLGTLIGGFLLVPRLGVRDGAIAIVVADLIVLAWVWFAAPKTQAAPARPLVPEAVASGAAASGSELPMLLSILLGGMVSLGLEAILFRVLGLLLGPTARAFTVVLAVYVLGLGIGSLAVRPIVAGGRRAAEWAYLACWLLVGGYGLVVHTQVGHFSELVAGGRSRPGFDLAEQLALRALVATLMLLPITIAFGASYSAAVAAATKSDPARAGRLYAALTLGNILGLAAAAWGVLPHFRLDRGLLVVLAAAFLAPLPALAAAALPRAARIGAAALLVAGAAVAWFALPLWPMHLLHTAAYMYEADTRDSTVAKPVVRFHRSAFETSVTVVQIGENRYLQLDGKTTGSTDLSDQATQGLLGALPTALHPHPRDVFVIGLGTGHTPAEVLRHPVTRVDCAEISPEVVLTMPFFAMVNRRCDQDPRFRMLEADGRTVLRYGATKYDIVISEPSNVWIPGVAHLFTQESFEDVRGCLAEGGLCVQWMQGYTLEIDTLRTIVRTFLRVFPHTTLWFSGLANPDLYLLGSLAPFSVDPVALEQRLQAAGAINVFDRDRPLTAVSLLRCFIAGPETLRRFAGEGPLTSDARPSLEYAAEAALITGGTMPGRKMIAEMCEPPLALLTPADPGSPDRAALAALLTRRADANRALSRALADISNTVASADANRVFAPLFALAAAYPDDPELRATIVASLAWPIGLELAQNKVGPQTFDFMRRVIAVDPENPESLKFAAMLAMAAGRLDDAVTNLDRYVAASQSWRVQPQFDRSLMLFNAGRRQEAADLLKRILEKDPYFEAGWRALQRCAENLGDKATAENAARRFRELTGGN